jgi:hypothetical protein
MRPDSNRDQGKKFGNELFYRVKSPFTSFVIPGLNRNPVFLAGIPAGVYPVLDTGRE